MVSFTIVYEDDNAVNKLSILLILSSANHPTGDEIREEKQDRNRKDREIHQLADPVARGKLYTQLFEYKHPCDEQGDQNGQEQAAFFGAEPEDDWEHDRDKQKRTHNCEVKGVQRVSKV